MSRLGGLLMCVASALIGTVTVITLDGLDAVQQPVSAELDTLPSFHLGAGLYVREFENSNGTKCVALDSERGVAIDCEWNTAPGWIPGAESPQPEVVHGE